jgi:hypothetical protein
MMRDDWLNRRRFASLEAIQAFATAWLWTYNNKRPDMGIGGIPPAQKRITAAWALLLNHTKNGELAIPETCRTTNKAERREHTEKIDRN